MLTLTVTNQTTGYTFTVHDMTARQVAQAITWLSEAKQTDHHIIAEVR